VASGQIISCYCYINTGAVVIARISSTHILSC